MLLPKFVVRQARMPEVDDGSLSVRLQGDLDRRGSGREMRVAFPPPGEDQPAGRVHHQVTPNGGVAARPAPPVINGAAWSELGAPAHPPVVSIRVESVIQGEHV